MGSLYYVRVEYSLELGALEQPLEPPHVQEGVEPFPVGRGSLVTDAQVLPDRDAISIHSPPAPVDGVTNTALPERPFAVQARDRLICTCQQYLRVLHDSSSEIRILVSYFRSP